MTYYGSGQWGGNAQGGRRDQPISKHYHGTLDILKGGFDWDAYGDAVLWLSGQLGDPVTNIQVTDTDGSFSVTSVEEARDHVEAEGTEVRRIACYLIDSRRLLKASVLFDSPPAGPIQVKVESDEHEQVLGFLERLKLHIERGLIRGASVSTIVEHELDSTEGPLFRRRLPSILGRKGVLVTVVVVAAIAAVVAVWLTDTLTTVVVTTVSSALATLIALGIARWLWDD